MSVEVIAFQYVPPYVPSVSVFPVILAYESGVAELEVIVEILDSNGTLLGSGQQRVLNTDGNGLVYIFVTTTGSVNFDPSVTFQAAMVSGGLYDAFGRASLGGALATTPNANFAVTTTRAPTSPPVEVQTVVFDVDYGTSFLNERNIIDFYELIIREVAEGAFYTGLERADVRGLDVSPGSVVLSITLSARDRSANVLLSNLIESCQFCVIFGGALVCPHSSGGTTCGAPRQCADDPCAGSGGVCKPLPTAAEFMCVACPANQFACLSGSTVFTTTAAATILPEGDEERAASTNTGGVSATLMTSIVILLVVLVVCAVLLFISHRAHSRKVAVAAQAAADEILELKSMGLESRGDRKVVWAPEGFDPRNSAAMYPDIDVDADFEQSSYFNNDFNERQIGHPAMRTTRMSHPPPSSSNRSASNNNRINLRNFEHIQCARPETRENRNFDRVECARSETSEFSRLDAMTWGESVAGETFAQHHADTFGAWSPQPATQFTPRSPPAPVRFRHDHHEPREQMRLWQAEHMEDSPENVRTHKRHTAAAPIMFEPSPHPSSLQWPTDGATNTEALGRMAYLEALGGRENADAVFEAIQMGESTQPPRGGLQRAQEGHAADDDSVYDHAIFPENAEQSPHSDGVAEYPETVYEQANHGDENDVDQMAYKDEPQWDDSDVHYERARTESGAIYASVHTRSRRSSTALESDTDEPEYRLNDLRALAAIEEADDFSRQ